MPDLNDGIDNFLRKTLWIWLPFWALYELIGKFFEDKK